MAVQIDIADDRLFETLPEFARSVWDFPDRSDFLNWFFYRAPRTKMFVAHDDGEWLACIGVFERDYTLGGGRFPCYETYAWASLQNDRSKGWGIKVMKAAFENGRPMVALGGSKYTEDFMPRLGFSIVGRAPSMVLPIKGTAVGGDGFKNALLRKGIGTLGRVLVPSGKPRSVRCIPLTRFGDAILQIRGLPGFHSCPDAEFFDWQDKLPDLGHFLPLYFVNTEDRPVGWCYARIAEEGRRGNTVGRILETTFSVSSTWQERTEMMALVVRALAGYGADSVRALTSCPETIAALQKLRFWSGRPAPAMVYRNGLDLGDAPVRISVLRADGGVLPIPSSLYRFTS